MLTVAVLQQKGGSGKTTLAINLAAAAHLDGDRALVVDMDRQARAFDWSAARQDGSPLDGLAVVKADRAIALPLGDAATSVIRCPACIRISCPRVDPSAAPIWMIGPSRPTEPPLPSLCPRSARRSSLSPAVSIAGPCGEMRR